MYTVGACSGGGQTVIQNNLKGFLATLPGVIGSTVQVNTYASVTAFPTAASVVKEVVSKAVKAQAVKDGERVTAKALVRSQLPPQINVSGAGQAGLLPAQWVVLCPQGGVGTLKLLSAKHGLPMEFRLCDHAFAPLQTWLCEFIGEFLRA
jgi:hypothetical protein